MLLGSTFCAPNQRQQLDLAGGVVIKIVINNEAITQHALLVLEFRVPREKYVKPFLVKSNYEFTEYTYKEAIAL